MPDKKRFEEFIEMIIKEGDWCYYDCKPMTKDAIAFLKWYRKLNRWVTMMKELHSD